MKKYDSRVVSSPCSLVVRKSSSGFSLVELMVAMAVFLVISGAAVRLVQKHVPMVSSQQNQAGLNMTMRNAMAQMQVDIVNAGSGYYPGADIPAFPIGVTITNNAVNGNANCYNAATFTYGQNCFDVLNVIASDPTVPPSHPTDIGTNCVSTTSSILFTNPVPPTTTDQLAAAFHNGDELLLLKGDGSQMTTVSLTKDGAVSGNKVQLQHNPTGADGVNTFEQFGIANTSDSNKLGIQFCTNDWVLKINAITYSVDASNAADPKLVRSVNGFNPNVIADQIIGFKVGAMTWNTTKDDDQATYSFNSSAAPPGSGCNNNCGYNNDWSLIRSVMVSVIGRTAPEPANQFRNAFDNGPYKVEAISVVINPRNLSMNGQ